MRTIYKYNVPGSIKGPIVRFLQPHMQNGEMKIWAELDDRLEEKEYYVLDAGTGWLVEPEDELYEFMEHGMYCGTVMDGCWVWHVYVIETHRLKNLESSQFFSVVRN